MAALCVLATLIATPAEAEEIASGTVASTSLQEETILSLTASLALISEAIRTSEEIAPDEKLVLYVQLIQLSQAIMSLRSDEISEVSRVVMAPTSALVSLGESSIHRVMVNLNWDSFASEVTVYEKTDVAEQYASSTRSVQLTKPNSGTFEDQVRMAKDELATMLSDEFGVIVDQLFGATFVSVRNPLRDERVVIDSPEAQQLESQFGQYSIITQVNVRTGRGGAVISVIDDQLQSLVLNVSGEQVQIERGVTGISPDDPRYSATLRYFILDDRSDPVERGDSSLRPRVTTSLTNLTPQELTDFLTGLLEEMPFTESIPDVEQRLFDYLLSNPATYVMPDDGFVTVGYPVNIADQCISPSDAVVMNEILLQLLRGLRVQYINTDNLYAYLVPVTTSRAGDSRCLNVRDFF